MIALFGGWGGQPNQFFKTVICNSQHMFELFGNGSLVFQNSLNARASGGIRPLWPLTKTLPWTHHGIAAPSIIFKFWWCLLLIKALTLTFVSLYFSDLVNGSRSPVIPSPPPPSANSIYERTGFLSPFASSDKQHHLEFGTVGQKVGPVNNNTLVTALINNAMLERNRQSQSRKLCFPWFFHRKFVTYLT